MITYSNLVGEFRLMFDAGDPWGDTMSAWFSTAAELYNRGATIPDEWSYKPGACVEQEVDDIWSELFEHAEDVDILKFGRMLSKYAYVLRTAGVDY